MMKRRTQNVAWMMIALGAVALATMSTKRAVQTRRPLPPARDYSHRSGFPMGVEASRGLARDAAIPADVLTPEPLRPYNVAG